METDFQKPLHLFAGFGFQSDPITGAREVVLIKS